MSHNVFVTIILPIRNEARYIKRCLTAIFNQNYPAQDMEILVADGMSTDETRKIVLQLAKEHPEHNVLLIENPQQILSTGFNSAICRAKGEIIFLLGGHTQLAPDYLRIAITHLQAQEIDCVGGALETIADDKVGKVIAVGMSSSFGVGGVAFRTTPPTEVLEVDTAAFGAYKRDAIKQCGLMDEEMIRNQDDEYNYRLRSQGRRIFLAPDLHLRYYSRGSLSALWRQYFRYGYWKVRVLQKHPRQMSLRQFVPPAFVFALLVSLIATFEGAWGIWLLTLVAGVYLVANLSASVITSAKKDWKHLPLLPLIFAILHLSYGLGFLVGLVKFANRWGDRHGNVPDWHSNKSQAESSLPGK